MQHDFKQLLNGAQIRGIAMDGIIGETVNLTSEAVSALARGFARWLINEDKRKISIAIGTDSRITGPGFMRIVEKSITEIGADVINCGLATTPAMLLTTCLDEVRADGAIMFTGSHSPYNRNGMKFFIAGRDITVDEMNQIIDLAQKENLSHHENTLGDTHICNILAIYSNYLRELICSELSEFALNNEPLKGLKIVVDAGNGAGGFFATHVLRPLGADVSDSQLLTPDGRFPNHVPNPDDYEAMEYLQQTAQLSHADLGILFDADVDRVGIVDKDGHIINRNFLVALTSAMVLKEHPEGKIVTDSVTSTSITKFIEQCGGRHIRYQRGYRNVIDKAKEEDAVLAIETSGHAAFKENDFRDDGGYAATRLIICLQKMKHSGGQLFSLIENFEQASESEEVRLDILDVDFSDKATEILSALRQYVTHIPDWEIVQRNYEGLRVMCDNGWFLCRLSLHDPVLSLNVESEKDGGVEEILHHLRRFFRNIKAVDSLKLYER